MPRLVNQDNVRAAKERLHEAGSKEAEAPEPFDVQALIEEKAVVYSDAWLTTGEVRAFLTDKNLFQTLEMSGYGHVWNEILSNEIKLMISPNKLDLWRDIAGYATLVINHIEAMEQARREHENA